MNTNTTCVMHGVDYRTGPECGPECKRLSTAAPLTLTSTLATESDRLRRALRLAINEAETALTRMDEGQRPSPYLSGLVFGQTTQDVESAATAVHTLLNYAGSPILPTDEATAALKGSAR